MYGLAVSLPGVPPPPVSDFITSYLPIPIFLLLTFGYKLINQTQFVSLEDMPFPAPGGQMGQARRDAEAEAEAESEDEGEDQQQRPRKSIWRRIGSALI